MSDGWTYRPAMTVLLALLLLASGASTASPQDHSAAEKFVIQTTANPSIEQAFVNTPWGQVHYWTAGSGPALLLIHQSSSTVEEYASLVPHLSQRYRLIAYDWPGHGQSDDPQEEFGVEEFTRSALAVLDELKIEKTHVLGHHGGALVAMNLAWKQPHRVDKIILSGTSGVKEEAESKDFTESLDLKNRNVTDMEGKSIAAAWQRYVGYLPKSSPEQILRPFVYNMANRLRPFEAHYSVLRWDRRPALASIRNKPVLLLQGENDIYVSHQKELLKTLRRGKRQVVADAGVFIFFERPEEAARLIGEFLLEQ